MAKLPKFLFCKGSDSAPLDSGLILFTQYPYFIGKIMLFKKESEFSAFIDKFTNSTEYNIFTKIKGYRIGILYFGSLEQIDVIKYKDEVNKIFNQMAGFYYQDRIIKKPGFYKLFKES